MTRAAHHVFDLPVARGVLSLDGRARIMGILNVTPDSFSDGGEFLDSSAAVTHGLRLAKEGADILDIGGESTRPGAREISVDEEIKRILPVLTELRRKSDIPVSIDTRKAAVAEAALDAGADIINDVSALRHDARMAPLAAERGVPVVLMHMQGNPMDMQRHPHYDDVIEDLLAFFRRRLEFCEDSGITHAVIDPGIGFGKKLEHNLSILNHLARLSELQAPLLVGTSRKSFIGQLTGHPADQRLAGSLASNVFAVLNGAHIVRVHDVREMRAALDVIEAIRGKEATRHAV
ncbi:MAG: dihydropteroate synthase [Ignavibacteria bacterium]|nr:MAG: dihydropteroate synthase [Ignavibacteria bacterium]